MQGLFLIGILLLQAPPVRPGGVISGRVVYSDGTPATINLSIGTPGQTPSRGVYPNANGEFRTPNVAPGRYYLRVGGFGDAPLFYPGVTDESAATIITVAADANPEPVTFTLPENATVRVSGRVIFPPNLTTRPPNQVVQLGGGFGAPSTPIAADGTFELAHVRPGRFQLTVTLAPGMQPVPIVVGDRDIKDVQLTVPRLTPIAGSVVLEGSTARPNFNVVIEGPSFRTTVPVGGGGTFTPTLPSGEYLVRLTGLPAGYYVKAIASDKDDLFVPNRLKIAGAASSTPIKITLGASPGIALSGRVAVEGGDGSSNVIKSVMILAKASDQLYELPLDAEGAFKLEKVMPGSYFARVEMASGLNAPLVPVEVPAKDVRRLDITVPREKEVFGHVTVDGYGPPPKFSLLLVRGSDFELAPAKPGELPALSLNSAYANRTMGDGVQMSVNALADGSFKMKLPEGDYRVTTLPGVNPSIPPAYFLRSLTYGSADLMKETMTVSERPSELQIGFGTTVPNPWVKVSGKVTGFDPAKGLYRVGLEGRTTSVIEAPVSPDGSFEFPTVLQGTTYTARIIPANEAATAPTVTVADKDVSGVQIIVPQEKEVRIVTSVENNGTLPGFVMTFAGTGSTVSVIVNPERDGSFRAKIPTDERRVAVTGYPLGYVAKSVTFSSTDVLRQRLKIGDDSSELHVAFSMDSNFPFGSLKGRISGLDPDKSSVRLLLTDLTAFSTFETSVDAGGAYSFARIPQGTYVPTLIGISGLLMPTSVVVSGTDQATMDFSAPKASLRPERPASDDGPLGVVVTSLGGSRQAANESAAIAQLRTINTAQVSYLSANQGKYGTIPDMINAGLLDARFNGTVSGSNFAVIAVGSNYTAVAIPANQGNTRYGFYSTPDAVIRYVTLDSLSPQGQGGKPVQ